MFEHNLEVVIESGKGKKEDLKVLAEPSQTRIGATGNLSARYPRIPVQVKIRNADYCSRGCSYNPRHLFVIDRYLDVIEVPSHVFEITPPKMCVQPVNIRSWTCVYIERSSEPPRRQSS